MKKNISLLFGIGLVLLFPITAYTHGGGLDSYGCHHNRKQGGYHCHRGSLAGQQFKSKDDMLRALQATKDKALPGTKQKKQ